MYLHKDRLQNSLIIIRQYLHPLEAAKYRNAARSVRAIGRDCIKRRIQSIEDGEQVPNDILTHILQISCEHACGYWLSHSKLRLL